MREFRVNNKITLVGNTENTRSGFRHRATLLINGNEVDQTTVSYQNRTWESYEYQTALQRLVDKTSRLSPQEKVMVKKWLEGDRTDWSGMNMTGMVAGLGDIFGNTPKEKNDWKARMLKAGLGTKGLSFPEGFDTLPEAERTARLDKVLGVLKEKGKKKKVKKKLSKKKSCPVGSAGWVNKEVGGFFK